MDKTPTIKVLHIISGDLWAGAEVQVLTLAKALKNSTNTTIDIVLLNHGELEQKLISSSVNTIVFDESKLNSLTILWKLIRIIRQIKPDVIHTHRFKENILGCVAAQLNGNIPTIRTSHGAAEHTLSWWQLPKRLILWLDFFFGRYLQHAIIAVSEELAEKLKKDFPASKVHVIENGIDLQGVNKHVFDKKLNATTDTFNIGFAGRLVPVKRVDTLLKTARYTLDNYPEQRIAFHIYGDGPLRDELERLNRNLKTDTIVSFEGHCNDILRRIQNMDALLITSDHEGLPMILLEAMALGTPIIAHAVGGIPHLLDQGRCGILITENKPANFAIGIDHLINSPAKISEITREAKRRVEEKYSAEKNAQAYLLLYNALL